MLLKELKPEAVDGSDNLNIKSEPVTIQPIEAVSVKKSEEDSVKSSLFEKDSDPKTKQNTPMTQGLLSSSTPLFG